MKALISIILAIGFVGCAKMAPVVAEAINDAMVEEAIRKAAH